MVKVFPNLEELNRFAAEKFVSIAAAAIEARGRFAVALAGGSTPKALYRLLAGDEFAGKIDWKSIYLFFGDERNVAADHRESNFRMAEENLFAPLSLAPENVFRWQTELENPFEIAADYEAKIKDFFDLSENELPRFDLVLLGMGDDGHTASLFPETQALDETKKTAVENRVEKLNDWRFTLTFPAINNARNVIFLIKGADKAETLREVLEGDSQIEKLPSQNIRPKNGELFWLIDETAAKFLKKL